MSGCCDHTEELACLYRDLSMALCLRQARTLIAPVLQRTDEPILVMTVCAAHARVQAMTVCMALLHQVWQALVL